MSEFFQEVFMYDAKSEQILNPTGLKNIIRKKFYPTMQHDSHEFFMHLVGTLQDEETPIALKKFNGDVSTDSEQRTLAEIIN
jgi:ubiquitin C-terminal hydrolase